MPGNTLSQAPTISTRDRRRSIVCAYANGAIWGTGSGLVSVTLVTYLARAYGATGMGISWLLAAPALVGMLRLLTPLWLEHVGSRQWFCIFMFLASAAVLLALPVISAPHVLPEPAHSIAALAVTWAGYHVLEYIGAVALWSWFADLAPRAIRGRFVGRRQAWTNGGKVLGTVAAAVGTYYWERYCIVTDQMELRWYAYAACGITGGLLYAIATWPLVLMVDLPIRRSAGTPHESLRHQLIGPWADRKFRRLLRFGLWFSFSNGLMQTAQAVFQINHIQFHEKKILDSSSRAIQSSIMPFVGDWVDRHGNVRVLAVSQALIATAPLFFIVASWEGRWWLLGAYVCWLAYAGENVTQPNLMLGLSPSGESAACASAWFAWTQLAYSLSLLVGGVFFDYLAAHFVPWQFGTWQIDHFAILFVASCLLKWVGVYWAARIRE